MMIGKFIIARGSVHSHGTNVKIRLTRDSWLQAGFKYKQKMEAMTAESNSDLAPVFATAHGIFNQAQKPLVIIATSGTGGDLLPFVTLGQGLLERGNRVLMLIPRFHDATVQASGLPFQTFGTHEEFQAQQNDPDL